MKTLFSPLNNHFGFHKFSYYFTIFVYGYINRLLSVKNIWPEWDIEEVRKLNVLFTKFTVCKVVNRNLKIVKNNIDKVFVKVW